MVEKNTPSSPVTVEAKDIDRLSRYTHATFPHYYMQVWVRSSLSLCAYVCMNGNPDKKTIELFEHFISIARIKSRNDMLLIYGHTHTHTHTLTHMYIYIYIFTNPFTRTGCDTRSIF